MTAAPEDEFRFLDEQAAALGVGRPHAERVTHTAADGQAISGLRLGEEPIQVTFLHGAGLNAHTWDTTALALDTPALALDLPGHGDSSWRADGAYRPDLMGPVLADAMAALTDAPQVLVGQSLGGLTAAWIAAHRPDLVRALILVDITPDVAQEDGPKILRDFYQTRVFPTRSAAVDHAIAFGLGGDRAATERGVFFNTRVRADGAVEWKHHFAELIGSLLPEGTDRPSLIGTTGWDDLVAVRAPITLVRGEHGFLSPAARQAFIERVPTAAVIDLDAGHNVQETAPVALAEIIDATSSV